MSCAIGIFWKNKIYMGVDSCASDGETKYTLKNKKIFKKGDFLVSFCGSSRPFNLIQYLLKFPSKTQMKKIKDDFKFISTMFVNTIKACILENGQLVTNPETGVEYMNTELLVAYNKNIYHISFDFQVDVVKDEYLAIGSGSSFALGSLHTTSRFVVDSLYNPQNRIEWALEAASYYATTVGPPFHFMSI